MVIWAVSSIPEPIGPRPIEHDDVALFDAVGAGVFHGGDGRFLAGKDAGRPGLPIDAVGVDDGRVDRRALDDRALGRQVAARER